MGETKEAVETTGPWSGLAQNARITRAVFRLTVRQVAERARLSCEMVRRIERGDPDVRLDAINALAWSYGLSLAAIFTTRPVPVLPDLAARSSSPHGEGADNG